MIYFPYYLSPLFQLSALIKQTSWFVEDRYYILVWLIYLCLWEGTQAETT